MVDKLASRRKNIDLRDCCSFEKAESSNCKSTAEIGYWDGRYRGPNFLEVPTVPPAIEYMSKRVRLGARTSQLPDYPTFGEISTWRAPKLVDTLVSRRIDIEWGRLLLVGHRRDFATVHLRPKLVTGMGDFRPRTFCQFPLFPPL